MAIVRDIGHIILDVGDMEKALRLYRDVLGFQVKGDVDPVWTVVAAEGGALTLYRRKDPVPCVLRGGTSPFNLHVANFEEAADALEQGGYVVHRDSENAGSVTDPWGNVLGLHDHRE